MPPGDRSAPPSPAGAASLLRGCCPSWPGSAVLQQEPGQALRAPFALHGKCTIPDASPGEGNRSGVRVALLTPWPPTICMETCSALPGVCWGRTHPSHPTGSAGTGAPCPTPGHHVPLTPPCPHPLGKAARGQQSCLDLAGRKWAFPQKAAYLRPLSMKSQAFKIGSANLRGIKHSLK